MHDALVAKVKQVVNGQASTRDLVNPCRQGCGRQVALDHNQRHPDLKRLRKCQGSLVSHKDDHGLDRPSRTWSTAVRNAAAEISESPVSDRL